MKIRLSTIARCMAVAVGIASSSTAFAADSSDMMNHIKSVTAITEVFGDGQKLTAVAVEYDAAIDSAGLATSSFAVEGRTVTKVYANTRAAVTATGANGRFAVVELSPDDQNAAILVQSGMTMTRREAKASVTQTGPVTTADGRVYAANAAAIESSGVINPIVDDFRQFEYKDATTGLTVRYNLFAPKGYDKGKSYPLVLFIHDGSACSTVTDTALIQGLGAVVWASPEEQAKHECFVLAPEFDHMIVDDDSKYPAELDATVNLLNSLTATYSIDRNRLYTTGQSMGGMSSIALDIKYPELFAASLLVACQWDASLVAPMADDNLWIIVSEGDAKAYPGQNAITDFLQIKGARVSRARWNGRADRTEFADDVAKMMAEGNAIKYVTLEKGTVVTPGLPDDPISNHICTWRIAYGIEGVRDWLFAQKK